MTWPQTGSPAYPLSCASWSPWLSSTWRRTPSPAPPPTSVAVAGSTYSNISRYRQALINLFPGSPKRVESKDITISEPLVTSSEPSAATFSSALLHISLEMLARPLPHWQEAWWPTSAFLAGDQGRQEARGAVRGGVPKKLQENEPAKRHEIRGRVERRRQVKLRQLINRE